MVESFKKKDYIITAAIAVIIAISGLSISDYSFLPENVQGYLITLIGICGVLAKMIPTEYRVKIAEILAVDKERKEDNEYVYIEDDGLRESVKNYIENDTDFDLEDDCA